MDLVIQDHEYNQLLGIVVSQRCSIAQAHGFVKTMAHAEKYHGLPWLVTRLKELRSGFLTGDLSKFRHHRDGTLYGGWRLLSQLAKKDGRRGRIAVDRLLRVYTRWEADKPSRDDYADHAASVDREVDGWEDATPFQYTYDDVRQAEAAFAKARLPQYYDSSPTKRVPLTRMREWQCPPHWHMRLAIKHCPSIMLKYRDLFDDIFPLRDTEATFPSWVPSYTNGDVVGEVVGLTKDGGLKQRFIANPHRALQWALNVLKTTLANYLAEMPESCVYDQHSALPWIQQKLKVGKLWSLDLSAATDHFPLSYQEQVVRRLFPMLSRDIDMWVDVSRALWRTPDGYTQWNTGQPMGLGPSFAAFTISHIHLIRSLGGGADDFRVIGDDVVIASKELADSYESVMRRWRVKISESKSLKEQSVAEIAGRVIDRHGVWPSYKGRRLNVSQDPLGFVRQYGIRAVQLLPRKLRDRIEFVARLPDIGVLDDYDALRKLPPELIYELYVKSVSEKFSPYPDGGIGGSVRAKPWMFRSKDVPVTAFERANPDGLLRLNIGSSNEPRLSQHISAVRRSGDPLPEVLVTLEETLDRAPFTESWRKKRKLPIHYVNRLWRLYNRHNLT